MTDYISRADAIKAVASITMSIHLSDVICDKLLALPSADAEYADLPDIPRYYYEKVVGNMAHEINMLKEQLESAEAEPTVIRSRTLMPTKDFKEWAKRVREENPNVIVIPCDAEVVSADAVQGDGRNNIKRYPNCQMRTSLGNCDAIGGFCTSINAPICDAFHKLSKAVQGEWIDIDNYYRMATCSRCHKVTMFEKWGEYTKPYDFCPNCGARMKGGAE